MRAPELMKRGSSTRIFREYLEDRGLEIPHAPEVLKRL
jgi:hypothetical protein